MNFVNSRCLLVVFVYFSAAVLVIVDGQSTTDDDSDKYDISKLIDRIAKLEHNLAVAIDTVAQLKDQLAATTTKPGANAKDEEQRGTSYIRWGRKTCENNSTLVYKGYAAGPHYTKGGSGSNFLCLPENPQWKTYLDGDQTWTGSIYGVEYELFNPGHYYARNNIFSEINNGGNPLADNPAPCAVCYVSGRSTVLMVPARTQCPDSWTSEYAGYLVSETNSNVLRRSSYICWDEAPEVAVSGTAQDQAVIYPVEVQCGSLPCSMYVSGRELTCIVCSK